MADKRTEIKRNDTLHLSLFEDQPQNKPDSKCNSSSSYLTCTNVKRLLFTLKYYETLKVADNNHGRDIFHNFITNTYKYQVYDDFNHFVKFHQDQLQDVKQFAIDNYNLDLCDLSECKFADRHYEVNENIYGNISDDDMTSQVYIETMDSLHFFLFHLYQSSLRIISKTDEKHDDGQNDNRNNPYFDPKLHRFNQKIKNSRKITSRFKRVNVANNKYNIFVPTTNQNEQLYEMLDIGDNLKIDCYLDYVFTRLSANNIVTQRMQSFIVDEEYDTESVDFDLNIFSVEGISNISLHVGNDTTIKEMIETFKESKSMNFFCF